MVRRITMHGAQKRRQTCGIDNIRCRVVCRLLTRKRDVRRGADTFGIDHSADLWPGGVRLLCLLRHVLRGMHKIGKKREDCYCADKAAHGFTA